VEKYARFAHILARIYTQEYTPCHTTLLELMVQIMSSSLWENRRDGCAPKYVRSYTQEYAPCHTSEHVMSHFHTSHVPHPYETYHTYEWVTRLARMIHVTHMLHICYTYVTHMCYTYVIVTHATESTIRHVQPMSSSIRTCTTHVTSVNESCRTYE